MLFLFMGLCSSYSHEARSQEPGVGVKGKSGASTKGFGKVGMGSAHGSLKEESCGYWKGLVGDARASAAPGAVLTLVLRCAPA